MLLEATQLSATLPGDAGDLRVLESVDVTLAEGEIVDVTGPSGAGKSTLLRALTRLLPDVTGELRLRGTAADAIGPQEWRCAVALLPQRPVVAPGSVRDNLLLPWRFRVRSDSTPPSEDAMRRSLDMLGLHDVALDRDAVRLSVGQQGRLGFARVWLTSPSVLLLDEADAALDDDSSAAMAEAVRRFAEQGGPAGEGPAGVMRVRHRGDDGLATRRLRLEGGRLVEVAR